MNSSQDNTSSAPIAPGGGAGNRAGDGAFDPRSAAAVLTDTRIRARRGFAQRTPLVCAFSALVLLVVYGALWLSVRNQHPYVGPTLGVVGLVYGVVAVSAVVSTTRYRRAVRGVHGQSRTEDRIAGLAVGLPWIAVYIFDAALHADGFGNSIVYGVFDAAAPWLVVGTALAALGAGRQQPANMVSGLAVVAAGTTAAFFGPAGCWGVLAIAGFFGLLALAAYQYFELRRA
jgi:hypothetical protein